MNHSDLLKKKNLNMSSISGLNFKSLFLSVDNEMKTSAYQMLAISLSGSFRRETAILYIVSETLPSVRSLLPQGAPAGPDHTRALPQLSWALETGGLPASLSQHRETRTLRKHYSQHSACSLTSRTFSPNPTWRKRSDPSPWPRRLISSARTADSKPGLDLSATSPDQSQNQHGTRRVTLNNLPSGSNVVSLTKLEGRARDNVAMATTTRQTKRPQLTMVTVPMPRPLPYLHVDVNPICTLPLQAWTASNAFSLRWAQGPRCCRCRCR